MPGSYEATKRWRLAHPEKAREVARNNKERNRRANNVPIRPRKRLSIEEQNKKMEVNKIMYEAFLNRESIKKSLRLAK